MSVPLAPGPSDDAVVASIRANIVFEKMIVSVLTVAGLAGAAHLLIGLGGRLVSGAFSPMGVMNALIASASFFALFFLAGFATAAAIGIPLYRALEKAKVRKGWPYFLVGFLVSLGVLTILGAAPSAASPARALYLLPGLAAAFLFVRRMRPLWSAAERAETSPAVLKLH